MYTDFAWECLRRNKYYISDWEAFCRYDADRIITFEQQEKLEKKWGLLRYENPYRSCPENVFWSESLSSRSIRVKLHSQGHTSAAKFINSGALKSTLVYNEKSACIKLYDMQGYMQIFIDENDLNSISEDKYIYISFNRNAFRHIHSLLSGSIPPVSPCADKMSFLYIYDKHSQGLTQKEIALYFFGEEMIKTEWGTDSWLRARIRYKLKIAEQLILHDFVKYL